MIYYVYAYKNVDLSNTRKLASWDYIIMLMYIVSDKLYQKVVELTW